MESETGLIHNVTPHELWESSLHDFPPRMLFLSGCSTGRLDKAHSDASFAWRMVDAGVPFVLGWALPVIDEHATAIAAALYHHLAIGKRIDDSVA